MNKVIQVGGLTKDPQLEYANGTEICKFSIAVETTKKDKNAEYIRWTVFGKQAENLCKYMKKGRQIAIEGHQVSGDYTNREGKKVYTQDNIADRIQYLGGGESKKEPEQQTFDNYEQAYDDIPF